MNELKTIGEIEKEFKLLEEMEKEEKKEMPRQDSANSPTKKGSPGTQFPH